MEKTPLSMRTHISIFGNTNSGKSSLFNKLLGQQTAIVSEVCGTTTDPVTKAMELIPYGPVALTDTAGWGDSTELGDMRQKKTDDVLDRTDFAIYTAESANFDKSAYRAACEAFKSKNIEHLLVFTKADIGTLPDVGDYPDSISVSVNDEASIEKLRQKLVLRLTRSAEQEKSLMGSVLDSGSVVVLVIPIDSEAPKGRLILPQVQVIRDCLDNGMRAVCVRDTELKEAIEEMEHIDLVVTDSQAFKKVSEIVPEDIMLTSFSMLMANSKCDINVLIDGADSIERLKDGSRVLMAEACTHNVSHEDIGRVKIPKLLAEKTGKKLYFDYCIYHDFPDDLSDYDLVIHCGGCMINSKLIRNRIEKCRECGVSVTNYGVALAYLNGISERSSRIFKKDSRER